MSNNNFENISLYIPRVYLNITQERIKSAFEKNGIGKVKRVDLLSKVPDYNIAYVHFDYWNDTITARNFQSHTKEQKGAKLVYDDPWHWIVLENKATRYEPGARKVRINLGDPRLNFQATSASASYVDPIDELMYNLRIEEGEIEKEREQREKEREEREKEQQENEEQEFMRMLSEMEEIDEELKNEDVSLVEAQYVEMLEASNASMFNQMNALQQENYQLHQKIKDLQEEHNIGLKVLINEIHSLRQQINK
jgi:vacuolar-type H+-ATPase subunit I/STV1